MEKVDQRLGTLFQCRHESQQPCSQSVIELPGKIRAAFDLARHGLELHDVADRDVPQLITQPGAADLPLIELI